MDLYDIAAAIHAGDFDEDLQILTTAIGTRQQVLSPDPVVGGRGILKGCRPLYLNGAPFTIVGLNRTRVVIKIDQPWLDAHPKATRWMGKVTCPRTMLDFS